MTNEYGLENSAVNQIRYNKHRRRKNNDLVAAMYAMYRTGKSLEEVARAYRRSRQAIYDLFRTRGYPLRGKILRGLTIVDGMQFTETKGGYLRGTVAGRRILLHWYVWEKSNGRVPEGFVIHHRDNDPKNNSLENLELVPREKMAHVFNPRHHNQHTKKK